MGLSLLLRCTAAVAFIVLCFTTVGADTEGETVGELPYCGSYNKSSDQGRRELIIVSTLDGHLSALDVSNDGALEWSVKTGPGPMLSSSIHRLELTNNGNWVRMIPSLSGGLYKFNGNNIEPIPITADSLLQSSSFLFSDDLVISGGKESRTYGVQLKTGHVLYECTMKGCENSSENLSDDEDMLVVQRKTQTVRAVEVRTGAERWNFSVGQHDLKLMSDFNTNCHDINRDQATPLPNVDFKVIVPEGLVCAISNSDSKNLIWKHKFDSPIVTAWHLRGGELHHVDLFSGSQWAPQYNTDDVGPVSPSLYIGMHKKQLYIQESVEMQKNIKMAFNMITDESPKYLAIPWAPVQATSSSLGFIKSDNIKESSELISMDDKDSATSLSVLYASEYVNGNGYYLFSEIREKPQCAYNTTSNIAKEDDYSESNHLGEVTPVEIIMGSLWHWWKEVLIISITTAALVNLIINRNLIHTSVTREVIRKEIIVVEKHIPVVQDPLSRSQHLNVGSNSDPSHVPVPEYTSRYLTDFDQVHCLGKGGFGVVFEAKNKIDDCHYAVKRIALPIKQESRDRVLREVKALAKLEHSNIVRYFNAWLEVPPAGWEEEQDTLLQNCSSVDAISINIPGQCNTPTNEKITCADGSSLRNPDISPFLYLQKKEEKMPLKMFDFSDDYSRLNNDDSIDQNDSFIVFEASDPDPENQENVRIIGDSVISVGSTNSGAELKSVSTWEFERSDNNKSSVMKRKGHRRPGSLDFSQSSSFSFSKPPTRVYLYIQMQLCRKESLREWLVDNCVQRSTTKVLHIFEQLVQAVEYVHLQGLIHRDLKPSNIFFSPDGQIKVGDFGLVTEMVEGSDDQRTPSKDPSSFRGGKHTAQVGTHLYMSPEQLMGKPYNYKVDIYSLGLILFELLVPFSTQMERGRILSDLRQNIFPTHFQQEYQHEFQLLQLMLSHKPEERPTTIGIRAKPPLCPDINKLAIDEQWHFELPQRRRGSSMTSLSNSSSTDSTI